MSKTRIKIHDFVKSELEYIEAESNFTNDELTYFHLRSKGKSNIEISMRMNISERTVSNLSKAVSRKIIKVL